MPRQFSALSWLLSVSLIFRSFTISDLFSMLNNICCNHVTHSAAVPRLLSVPQNNCFSVAFVTLYIDFCCCYKFLRIFLQRNGSQPLFCVPFWLISVPNCQERSPTQQDMMYLLSPFGEVHYGEESISRGQGSTVVDLQNTCPASVSCADIFVRFKLVIFIAIMSGEYVSQRSSS